MRVALWPEDEEGEHLEEIEAYFARRFPRWPWTVLLACAGSGAPIGFAEVSIRPWAQGCTSTRVAYLEGWYVEPAARRAGAGRALVRAAEDWGRALGCTEMGSDADAGNSVSHGAHLALGFEDEGVVRCFRKELPPR